MESVELDLVTAASQFGIDPTALHLIYSHILRSTNFPYVNKPHEDVPVPIYLDQLHWIALAKAMLGRPAQSDDSAAFEMLKSAAAANKIIVPISAVTYMETARISSFRQRTNLATTIGQISGFLTLGSASLVVDTQIRQALARRFGGQEPMLTWPFGIGVGFAFGKLGGMRIFSKEHSTEVLSPRLSHLEAVVTAIGEYQFARGPAPDELADLRSYGYKPEEFEKFEDRRLEYEEDVTSRLDAHPDLKGRIDDVVAARHLHWELNDTLPQALADFGVSESEFFGKGKEWLNGFLADVPSAAINLALRERQIRNRSKAWTKNDIRDFDAMAEAIPYCRIVMADKHVAAQLNQSGIAERYETYILPRLSDLVSLLPKLIS